LKKLKHVKESLEKRLSLNFKIYIIVGVVLLILAILGAGYLNRRYKNSVHSAVNNTISVIDK
jgi:hypothetical protein